MFMLTVPKDYAVALGLGENRKPDNLLRFEDFIKVENQKVGKKPAIKTTKDYNEVAKDGYVKLRQSFRQPIQPKKSRGVKL